MQFLRWALMILVVVVVGGYLCVCVALFAFQRSLIYFPQPRSARKGSELITLQVGDATVHVSGRPQSGPAALIYFGGNAEDVSLEVPHLASSFPERAIYALHYPGYGGSSGKPTQEAIFRDALAVYDRVYAEHANVVVIGRSLGSGVAVWVASQRTVERLVLVTPFDSLSDAAAAQFPFVPVRLLLRDKFDSGSYAPQVNAPTRIVVAAEDEIVPRSSSDRLLTRFRKGVASYVVLRGVGHNTVQNSPDYWAMLSRE